MGTQNLLFDGLIHKFLKLIPLKNGYIYIYNIIYHGFLGVITVITHRGVNPFIFFHGFWGPKLGGLAEDLVKRD